MLAWPGACPARRCPEAHRQSYVPNQYCYRGKHQRHLLHVAAACCQPRLPPSFPAQCPVTTADGPCSLFVTSAFVNSTATTSIGVTRATLIVVASSAADLGPRTLACSFVKSKLATTSSMMCQVECLGKARRDRQAAEQQSATFHNIIDTE